MKHPKNAVPADYWTAKQSYILATITLLVGLLAGYLVRGSGAAVDTTSTSTRVLESKTSDNWDHLSSTVQPLLAELSRRPSDFQLLVNIGNTYYDNHAYPPSIEYYEKALAIKPEDPDVRTDMGTAIWYNGDADRALKEYERVLQSSPNHPNALFNTGIVRLHGKNDPKGARESWDLLLRTNPSYPDRQKVLNLIQDLASGKS